MRYRLRTLLILMAAVPIWAYLIVVIPQSPGFGGSILRFVTVPIVLVGITAAIYRLTRTVRDGLAIAALLSPIISLGFLLIVVAILRNGS